MSTASKLFFVLLFSGLLSGAAQINRVGASTTRASAALMALDGVANAIPSVAIQYVSANGSDSNNGLTWGTAKATISAAVTALPATGGRIEVAPNYATTITSTLDVGSPMRAIDLSLAAGDSITCSITNGTYCIEVFNGSVLHGPGVGTEGVTATIALSPKANVAGVITTGAQNGRQEFFSISGIAVRGDPSASVVEAMIDLSNFFVPSYLRDVVIYNYANTIGLWIHSTSTTGPNVVYVDNVWSDAGNRVGATPCVVSAPAGRGYTVQNVNFYGGACEHAGDGYRELELNGNGTSKLYNVSFFGTQFEANPANTAVPILIKDAREVSFYGTMTKDLSAAPYAFQISQSVPNNTDGILLSNVRAENGTRGCIDDTVTREIFSCNGAGANYFYSVGGTLQNSSPTFDSGIRVRSLYLASGTPYISAGTITLSGGSGSHKFTTSYPTAPTCTATDSTADNPVRVTATTTAVSVTGTGGDVISWICTPRAN